MYRNYLYYLFGDSEDGANGASHELKNRLNEYKNNLLKFVAKNDQSKIKLDIDTENPKHTENNENWELYNFYHRPLVASITILSKIKVSSNDKVRIALIGSGIIGHHDTETALKVPGVELVAVADLYQGRLDRAKEKWGNELFVTRR